MQSGRCRLTVLLFASGVILAACTGGTDETRNSPSTNRSGPTVAVATPFDPPTSFDVTQAVPLDSDEVVHGTLHGTALFSVVDGTLRATDLLSGERSWSVDLSGDGSAQEYLGSPFVFGDIVVTVTAENLPPDPDDQDANPNRYVFNAFGVDADTGAVVWEAPIHSGSFDHVAGWVSISEREGAALVALVNPIGAAGSAVVLLDPNSGEIRWSTTGNLVATATGPYALVARGSKDALAYDVVALDLTTGQTRLLDEVKAADPQAYPDFHGDDAYAVARLKDELFSEARYVRFSSTDGTSEPIVIADDDVRYQYNVSCAHEIGQPVTLCQDLDGTYGLAADTGRVLWEYSKDTRLLYAVQYHGTVYGAAANSANSAGGMYQAVRLDTGEIINPELGIHPIKYDLGHDLQPMLVNEYGAIGTLHEERVWVPASG